MEYIAEKRLNGIITYGGFNLRTRRRYHDVNIIHENIDYDFYQIPKQLTSAVDIGANVGIFSLICASRGAEVYAYEPEKTSYDVLLENIKLNGYQEKIHSHRSAVGVTGKVRLYIHESNSGACSTHLELIGGLQEEKYQDVDSILLAEVFRDVPHCDLLKIDCEGSEAEILPGMREVVSKIEQVSVEFHKDKVLRWQLTDMMKEWFPVITCTYRRNLNSVWVFKKHED